MPNRIYVGNVRHHRLQPVSNRFTYSIYLLMLDLDELENAFARNWFWSGRRFNLAWFRESDHLRSLRRSEQQTLKQLIVEFLAERGVVADGPVRLLTQVRHFGFLMNPASFFYCYDQAGNLRAVVTQVNNTPWGEEYLYLVKSTEPSKSITAKNLDKEFHVSPFMPLDMQYDMAYSRPGDKLAVRMSNFSKEGRMLDVVMSLTRREWTAANLNWLLITYPLMSLRVFMAIYFQALKLFLKKVTFYSHPKRGTNCRTNSQATQLESTDSIQAHPSSKPTQQTAN